MLSRRGFLAGLGAAAAAVALPVPAPVLAADFGAADPVVFLAKYWSRRVETTFYLHSSQWTVFEKSGLDMSRFRLVQEIPLMDSKRSDFPCPAIIGRRTAAAERERRAIAGQFTDKLDRHTSRPARRQHAENEDRLAATRRKLAKRKAV